MYSGDIGSNERMENMRKCKGSYAVYNEKTHRYEMEVFEKGVFHQWGCSYEEFETGIGNFTVAVVELPDGKVIMPAADRIQFID